MSSASDWASF